MNFILIVSILLLTNSAHIFSLNTPKRISDSEIESLINTITYEMEWTSSDGTGISFSYKERQTTMKITSPESLKKRCMQAICTLWQIIYSYFSSDGTTLIAEPLQIEGDPQECSIEQIASLLVNKKVIFYTGAGISAGVVPTMNELLNSFSLMCKEDMVAQSMMNKVISDPNRSIAVMDNFYRCCLYGKSTDAHYAVASVADVKKWPVVTENLDLLHERSGIMPVKRTQFKADISVFDLQTIDAMIVIGLASDESGLLACFKKHNPKGIIIAINLTQPTYLSDDDFLILQNAQIALPALNELLKN